MNAPTNDRSRPQAAPESFGGDTHTIPSRPPWCCTDTHGLVKAACYDMSLDQYRRGYMLGYAQGARRVEHDVDQSVRRIMRDLDALGWGGL